MNFSHNHLSIHFPELKKKNRTECVTNTGVKMMGSDDLVLLFRTLLLNRKFLCSEASQMWQMCPVSLYFLCAAKVVHSLCDTFSCLCLPIISWRWGHCVAFYTRIPLPTNAVSSWKNQSLKFYSFTVFVCEGHAFVITCRNIWHFTIHSFFKM